MYATALADEVIIPSYAKLATEAREFSAENGVLANYCSAISSANEAQAFNTAETGLKDLVRAVQRAEMHAIGPATDNGKALQYRLNSYMSGPISTCGIDSIAASENVDVASRSLNARASGRWITFFSIAILRTLARLQVQPPLTGMSCLNPTEKLPDVMLLLPLPRIFRTPRRKFTALGAHREETTGQPT